MKVTNKIEYQQLIEFYRGKYLKQYTAGRENAGDKDHFRTDFLRNVLEKDKHKLETSLIITTVLAFRNEQKSLKNVDEFDAIKVFCKLHKQDLLSILGKVAKHDAILLVWMEIDKTIEREFKNNDVHHNQPLIAHSFKLNDIVISKIDFIRIINVLWELKGFEISEGGCPTKENTMKTFGNIIGIDLSNYDKDLSKALKNSSLETNVGIFEKMINKATSIHTDKASS
jgi:hypothetical protein